MTKDQQIEVFRGAQPTAPGEAPLEPEVSAEELRQERKRRNENR